MGLKSFPVENTQSSLGFSTPCNCRRRVNIVFGGMLDLLRCHSAPTCRLGGLPSRATYLCPEFQSSYRSNFTLGPPIGHSCKAGKLEQLPFDTKIPKYQYIRCNLLIRETQDTWLDLDPGSRPLGILCSAVGFKVEIRIGIRRIMVLQTDFWSLLEENGG